MLRKEEPHVVVLGGGFGGLATARALRRAPVRVTLVDRSNHHLFQPLLYQVATAALAAPDIASPIRRLLAHQRNATVLMGEVARIDPAAHEVWLEDGSKLAYDYLVVATGMTHAYFGHDEWAAHAPGLKSLGEAIEVRNDILRSFERAEREPDPARRRELTTFVVIGAGPTGVELAGALAEIAGRTLAKDFRHFDPTTTRVVLVEAGPRILPTFAPELSDKALAELKRLGVEVRLSTKVTKIEEGCVHMGDEVVRSNTILWAAGVRASPLTKDLGTELDRAGRVKVADDCTVPARPEIFMLGDLISKEQDGKMLPGVAQLALQTGRHAAKNIVRSVKGQERLPFRYRDKGSMATIGRAKAIAEIGRVKLAGFVAWVLWLFIHVMFLVEFRNRLAVLFEWAWAYLTWQRSSRVILETPSAPSTRAVAQEASQARTEIPAQPAAKLPGGAAPTPAVPSTRMPTPAPAE
ncbi:NAD(P)/FAD-dependent oxidoreductase [Sandaracinus amylolyticus]|uniref:NADH:ubiquinone reductase (non-electrogenic) n=1 Tax=Sandaracinus amylolyticus TaxID=927083 RepID=A0A0F6YKP5_9BACT|nr:NAD(P)/FAD-dependent oxidoreductase [Sandaracinus amylolyticus]AKF07520.1 NADH dehydrogenase [Sandaracinus amylolyticus]